MSNFDTPSYNDVKRRAILGVVIAAAKKKGVKEQMYTDDDILSLHDRAAEGLLRQMSESGCGRENGFSYPSEPFLRGGCSDDSHHSWGLIDYPLAMVYSPVQKWRNIYDGETALVRGTIFEELDLPFMGKCYCEREGCSSDGNSCQGRCGGGRNG